MMYNANQEQSRIMLKIVKLAYSMKELAIVAPS